PSVHLIGLSCTVCPARRSPTLFLIPSLVLNYPPTTEIYTLSLHDALPISVSAPPLATLGMVIRKVVPCPTRDSSIMRPPSCWSPDRKSTRLNSSHVKISYAVFCLKKKKVENEIRELLDKMDKSHKDSNYEE